MKGLTTKQKFQLLDIADNIQKRAFYKPGGRSSLYRIDAYL